MKKLEGRVAVITGGNSGIGLGIAKRFSAEGAKLVIFGRDPKTLAEAEQQIDGECLTVSGDVSRISDLERLYAQTIERFGCIDMLVANAGGATIEPFAQVSEASFDAQSNTNFKGLFFTVQKALPHLKDGASIVLMSSVANCKGIGGMSVYGAAKAAVRSLARTLTAELAPSGIRVNAISPGPIDTPIFSRLGLPEADVAPTQEAMKGMVPMGRLGRAEDIASLALFLAGDESVYVSGAEFVADGGMAQV